MTHLLTVTAGLFDEKNVHGPVNMYTMSKMEYYIYTYIPHERKEKFSDIDIYHINKGKEKKIPHICICYVCRVY